MCSIAGYTGTHKPGIISKLLKVLYHRGPDEEGRYTDGKVHLCVNQLSIIDIKHGTQPMSYVNGILCIFEHNPYNPITQKMVSSCIFDQDAQLISRNNMEKLIKILSYEVLTSKYSLSFPKIFSRLRLIEPYLGWIPLGEQYFIISRKL